MSEEYEKAVNTLIDVSFSTIRQLASVSESPAVIADIAMAIEKVQVARETKEWIRWMQ